MALKVNPKLKIRVITPPLALNPTTGKPYKPNYDLLEACDQFHKNKYGRKFRNAAMIQAGQCINNLFPKDIIDVSGNVITTRPAKYNPPTVV